MTTLQNAGAIISAISNKGGDLVDQLLIPVGQAVLVIAAGNTVTVYTLSATDTGIADLTKVQVATRTVS